MECQKYVLDDGDIHEIICSDKMQITVSAENHCSVYLICKEKMDCTMTLVVEKDAHLNLLSWNESEALNMNCEIILKSNAFLKASYGEMSEGSVSMKNTIHLMGEGSQADIRTASIVQHQKHFEISCIHHASHTIGLMENYAVIYEDGDYKMNDTGKIEKGAYGSESHQTSRVLTLSEKQKSEVIPLLLIDENDVQASHATSIGQIDENQLYYLQTRGLSKKAALGLITVGYLMPIASALDDEKLSSELSQKIEKKVGLA